ncbi:MAG: lipopolysaccharide biosynthesis protein [Euryarchaeota archaeon TMED141]|nr:MAG: lipopolysaccharide biosynthesis protein [Euryarchaeota archaeon TMED141]
MSDTAGRPLDARRDAAWLSIAEISAVGLALIGQVLLTSALIETVYGRWILLLDVFIAAFLVLDLGLPTLLARDGPLQPSSLRPAVWRVWRIQATVAVPVALLAGGIVLQRHPDVPLLVTAAAAVSLLHLATYAPRAALRAAGEARLEAWSKVIERSVMTGGYAFFMLQGETAVLPYAMVLVAGATAGLVCSAMLLHRTLGDVHTELGDLGSAWGTSWRPLVVAGAPFALTAAVLPYVSRIEKFLLAETHGYDAVAVFHVAQMAWAAGLVVPAAVRSALIPAFGAVRSSSMGLSSAMREAEAWMAPLVPAGLFAGAWAVPPLFSLVFPASYTNGALGADAAHLFLVLLPGWGLAMMATPSLAGVQAGLNPWRYAGHAAAGLCCAVVAGVLLVPNNGPIGAAWAALSVCTVLALLALLLRPSWREFHGQAWIIAASSCLLVPWLWTQGWWASFGTAALLTWLGVAVARRDGLAQDDSEG